MANPAPSPWLRLLLVLSVGILIVQLAIRTKGSPRPSVPVSTVAIKVGDTLADVPLTALLGSPNSSVSLGEVLANSPCSILSFFDSTCPICIDVAPDWSEVKNVIIQDVAVPVYWVSIDPGDSGAERFLEKYRLPSPSFTILNPADIGLIGVTGTPTFFLVGGEGVFYRRLEPNPKSIKEFPLACMGSPIAAPDKLTVH